MIPKVDNDLLTLEVETQPSLTYALDIEHRRIRGMVDELESLRQAIYLILSTERYAYLIYSWNYGVELVELIGQPKEYARFQRLSVALQRPYCRTTESPR